MGAPLYVWGIGGLAAWMVIEPNRFRGSVARAGAPPMKKSTTRVLGLATLAMAMLLYANRTKAPALPPPPTGA